MQLSFRTRLMIGTTALVVLFVAVAAVAFSKLIDSYFDGELERKHTDARASFDTQRSILLDSLNVQASELARSPRLLATVAIEGIDEATVADLLPDLPAAIIAVLTTDGRVLAGLSSWPTGSDLSSMTGYQRHLEAGSATHVWPHPDGLAVVGVAPLEQAGELLGSLVIGELVDDSFATRIGTLAGRDVLLADGERLLGSHWSGTKPTADSTREVITIDAEHLPEGGQRASVTTGDSEHAGIAIALAPGRGVVFLAHDLEAVYALRSQMRWVLFVIGAGLIAGGLWAAKRTATRLSRPLHKLTEAADQLRDGALETRVGAVGADRELSGLASSFDAMACTMQELVADVRAQAARAEAANRAKDGFLTSMSHELRTPLTGIQSTAELLQQFGDQASAEEQADFLTTILQESERLGRRITDTLEYAALAGDTNQWTVGTVDLQEACEQACRRIASLQQLKQIGVQIHCEDTARMAGDRERIVQAIEHLVRNAWQWSPNDGSVDITVHSIEGGFVVDVEDRGPGLPADQRARAFELFSQAGDVLVDKPDGIGIGLQIAAEVARMHNGSIDYSDREGGGACFHLLLRRDHALLERAGATN